jgi:hypothetical protein
MRSHPAVLALGLVIAIAISGCGGSDNTSATPTIGVPVSTPATATSASSAGTPVANAYAAQPALSQLDFGLVTGLYPIPGDPGFGYLTTKDGKVRRVSMTGHGSTHDVVLDLSFRLITSPGQEEGLLGLAFAPDFETSRRIYVNYRGGRPARTPYRGS